MNNKNKGYINMLTMFKDIGLEVVKANDGQIALNKKDNSMPFVMTNDIGYLTPLPYAFELIENEIKRLEAQNDRG